MAYPVTLPQERRTPTFYLPGHGDYWDNLEGGSLLRAMEPLPRNDDDRGVSRAGEAGLES